MVVGDCDLFLSWVLVGVFECDLFLAGCELVWPFSGWVRVGVRNCDLFLAGCGWVWVSVRFITSHPLSY